MFTKKTYTIIGSLSLGLLLHTNLVKAQQIPYSQYLRTPMFTNPAEVAAGNERQAVLNYRRQGSGEEDRISSSAVSYIHPFQNRETGRKWGGVGLSVLSEQAGYQGMLQNTGVMAAYAHTVYLTQHLTMS